MTRDQTVRPDLRRARDDPYAAELAAVLGSAADPHTDGWGVAAGAAAALAIDRQRVVHAAAFRRLQYKTQVFVTLTGDHVRTRLTHTLEVAQTALLLARRVGMSAELAEIVALAHDLGHPPFGHAGERALAFCLRDQGGFEHNAQSLRVVDYLEHPYPAFRGLNLTQAVRACLAAHQTPYDRAAASATPARATAPRESDVVALADRLTYALHDLQDGAFAGLLTPARLAEWSLWPAVYNGPQAADGAWLRELRPAVDRLRARFLGAVEYVPEGTNSGANDVDGPRAARVLLEPQAAAELAELEQLLLDGVYRDERVQATDELGYRRVVELFARLAAAPDELPPRFRQRISEQGVGRVVCDYLAGMTDRFCLQEHARLCEA